MTLGPVLDSACAMESPVASCLDHPGTAGRNA